MKSKSRSAYLINNTIIFAIGNFATKLLTFLLVPLYTNILSTSEYGTVDLLYTICSFLVPLFSFNISEAILRFSLDKDKDKNKIMSIAFFVSVFMVLLSVVVIPILNLFQEVRSLSIYFYIYLITFGISQMFLIILKGEEKLKLFSLGNFIYALFVSLFNILFLVLLKRGMRGYFEAYIVANIIVIVYSFFSGEMYKLHKNFSFDKKLFVKMIKYSIILIPTSFMWWIMNFLDRIMITKYINLSANGLYAVSYKIPTILSVLSSIFTQAWLFSAVKEKESLDNKSYTNTVFRLLSFTTFLISGILLLLLKPIFHVFIADNYYIAWKYVPPLMIGYIFMTLGTFISTSYNVNKDSKGYLFSALSGAVINVLLNLILIPYFGVYGAAFATMISYITVFIYRVFDTRKYIRIDINKKFILSTFLLIIIAILLYIQNGYVIIFQILLLLLLLVIYKEDLLSILTSIKKKIL